MRILSNSKNSKVKLNRSKEVHKQLSVDYIYLSIQYNYIHTISTFRSSRIDNNLRIDNAEYNKQYSSFGFKMTGNYNR